MTLTEFLLARIAEDEAYVRRDRFAPVDMSTARIPMTAARLLAECEAKRRVVRQASRYPDGRRWALRILAAVYADHPDYYEGWRA